MERFGSFEEDGFKFEAFSARDKEGRYVWKIIVTRDGREIRKETLEMEHFTDEKTGETEWINNPRDMANIAIMEGRSAEILEELRETLVAKTYVDPDNPANEVTVYESR